MVGLPNILFEIISQDIFTPNTRWTNKNGLLYSVNFDATNLADHQNFITYTIIDV